MKTMTPEEIERIATKRAGAKLRWYMHAAVFVSVNLFLFTLSHYALGTRDWSVKPLLGWGFGLVLHGIAVWFLGAGSGLREGLVQRERAHLQRQHNLQDKL